MTTSDITTPVVSTANEETALIVRSKTDALAANPQLAAQTSAIEVLKQRAQILVVSGFLPDAITNWQQAAAIMMRAEELDVDYWTGLMHLNAIKGAPQPDGQLCQALIQRSGLMERYEILATTDQICTIRMKRVGQPTFDVTCTYEEYAKVGGPDKAKQPKTHLFWYTYKQGARRLFSDVLNNMHSKQQTRPVIIEDDLPTDLPDDDVYMIEEGEDKPTATVPLSAAPSASALPSATTVNAVSGDPEAVTLGSLNLKSLQERALRAGLADNEFHFANLLKQLLADGTIREGATGDNILASMSKHKADKENASEGELVEPEPPPVADAFDDEFPPIGVVPQEPPPTIGSLNMESLWMRSRINPKSAFHQTVRDMRAAGKIKDNLTADQVVDAIKAWQAAVAFTAGEAGAVEE